jgi:hypothetical protein
MDLDPSDLLAAGSGEYLERNDPSVAAGTPPAGSTAVAPATSSEFDVPRLTAGARFAGLWQRIVRALRRQR